MTDEYGNTQTYYAKSIFMDGQTWFSALSILAIWLETQGARELIPAAYQAYVVQGLILINMFLRWNNVRRPVAFIAPGRTKKVQVKSLEDKTGRSL